MKLPHLPLVNRLQRLLKVHATYSDQALQQQAQRLLIINFVWFVAILVFVTPIALYWAITDRVLDAATAFLPFTLLIAGLNYYLIQREQLNWARILFVLNVLVAAFLSTLPNYRIDTMFIIAVTIPLTAAGVLLRRSGLFGVALLIVIITTVAGIIQIETGMAPTPTEGAGESIRVTIFMVAMVVLVNTVILWAFVSGTENLLQQQFRLRQLLERSSQINQSLVALPGSIDTLDDLIEQLRDTLGLYHVQVFLSDFTTGLAVLQASTGFVGRRLMEEQSLLIPDESSPVNDALRQTEPIIIQDTSPADKQVGFLPATRSEVLYPLRIGDRMPMGVLDLHSTSSDTFSPNMMQAIASIANHLATALYSAGQEKDLRDRTLERDRLSEQMEANQRELVRLNRQLVGATWGMYIDERRDLAPSFEWINNELALVQRHESSLLSMTLEDGQPRLEQRDGQDILCVPIRLRGQLLGAVEFQRPSEVGWSPSALELAQAVSERLALSLENARLFEQAQMTAHREQLVSQITAQMQTATDLQSLLTVAAAQFQNALGATVASIRLEPSMLEEKQEQENASAPS
jgi:GAF domain-containing protein